MTDPKHLVQQLVDDVINANDNDVLDDIATPALARTLRRAFDEFRSAFPDWHQEIVELVAEGDTVVARFRCTGTHQGTWQGLAPTGRSMRIDEVYFFRTRDSRLARAWGLEDTWTRHQQLRGTAQQLGDHGSLDDPILG
ncbi:MAG TPA: ester cyclase [Acidimicrobiales bacterium]|nr:ester cyclase [Acidimicrobiales bacterium]